MGTDTIGSGLPWVDAIAASFPHQGFRDFHEVQLPALVAGRGPLVTADLAGVAALGFVTDDGEGFTWFSGADGVVVREGTEAAATLVELSEATFSEFLHELL